MLDEETQRRLDSYKDSFKDWTKEDELKYLKAILYQRILELDFSPWLTSSDNLPEGEGVIVSYNPVLKQYIPSYTNNFLRRYEELLEEENTKDMSRFCFAYVSGHEQRKYYRETLKSVFVLDNWR